MRIPPIIKDVVGFIFISNTDGNLIPNGTGFFVGVGDSKDPKIVHSYFITARHVLCDPSTGEVLPQVFVRLNTRSGGAEVGKLLLQPEGENKRVYFPEDPSVDLAAIPFCPDQQKLTARALPSDYLVSKKDFQSLGIGEGSNVFFTGMFIPVMGAQKNYPIVRFGSVALITDEKISFAGNYSDYLLIEASSYGGNSGSPVFYYLGSDRTPGMITGGEPILKLAGVMAGRFNDLVKVQTLTDVSNEVVAPNLGIAAVVPSYKLYDLLFSNELRSQRGEK